MPAPDASKHVKLLSAHGVIDTRPSGTVVIAGPGQPSDTGHIVLRRVRLLLRRHLKESTLEETVRAVCPDREEVEWGRVFEAMCFEFTAYTHLRRLLILQMLCRKESADLLTIRREIGMSHTAVCRQTDKLVRRGLLQPDRDGRGRVLRITRRLATPFRSSLFSAVRDYLASV